MIRSRLKNGILLPPDDGSRDPERLHQNHIRFVYFDVGRVLYHFEGGIPAIADLLGTTHEICAELWKEYDLAVCRAEMTPQDLWKRCKELTGYNGPDIDLIDFWSDHFDPIPETHELLRRISEKLPIGLLTNVYPGSLAAALRKGKLPDISYAAIISSCDLRLVKPQDDIFEVAQKKAGVSPEEILFIDDSTGNMEAPTRRNWKVHLFDPQNPAQSVRQIEERLGI